MIRTCTFQKIKYAYHTCTLRSTGIMLLTDWFHTFIEITLDNRTNVAIESEMVIQCMNAVQHCQHNYVVGACKSQPHSAMSKLSKLTRE